MPFDLIDSIVWAADVYASINCHIRTKIKGIILMIRFTYTYYDKMNKICSLWWNKKFEKMSRSEIYCFMMNVGENRFLECLSIVWCQLLRNEIKYTEIVKMHSYHFLLHLTLNQEIFSKCQPQKLDSRLVLCKITR